MGERIRGEDDVCVSPKRAYPLLLCQAIEPKGVACVRRWCLRLCRLWHPCRWGSPHSLKTTLGATARGESSGASSEEESGGKVRGHSDAPSLDPPPSCRCTCSPFAMSPRRILVPPSRFSAWCSLESFALRYGETPSGQSVYSPIR